MATRKSKPNGRPIDPQTRMAADRTFLAYVRTGLGMMTLGFVMVRFNIFVARTQQSDHASQSTPWLPLWVGLVLTAYGVAINLFATVQHRRLIVRANRGEPYEAPTWSPDLVVGIGMAVLGALVVIDLFLTH